MRKFALLLCFFWVITSFAKTPVQFCVSFEDEDHYRLLLLDETPTDFTPSKKIERAPDSISCNAPFWAYSFWPSFEGDKRSNFRRRDYDRGELGDLNKQCNEKNLSASTKKATPPLEWNTSTIDGSIYHKENARKFIQKFYNKTFTGYWMADLACTCPHFEKSHYASTIKAKIVGECKPDFKKELRTVPKAIPKDTAVREWERKPAPIANPDWIPCYTKDYFNGGCKIQNYASKKTLPVHGKSSGIDESLECYRVDGQSYINFGTDLPAETYNKPSSYRTFAKCYTDSTNCNYSDSTAPQLTAPFYICEKFNLKEGGCEPMEHGIDFIIGENLQFEGWNRKGMQYFFRQKNRDIDEFIDYLFYFDPPSQEYREILPEGISGKDIVRMGDEAARKTPGMFFYDGLTKVGYEKFERPMFKNLKEAMQHCKEHRF
jgi:hypothetical protein